LARFSERIGVVKPRYEPQVDDIDGKTRNMLWNAVSITVLNTRIVGNSVIRGPSFLSGFGKGIAKSFYVDLLYKPHDEGPNRAAHLSDEIKEYLQSSSWVKVYDLIEWIVQFAQNSSQFESEINRILEQELSAYRLINTEFVQITSENEIEEVNNAIAIGGKFASASKHLASAVTLLSDRQNPDFPNSIKESISSVEAVAKIITGDEKASLGKALKVLEKNGYIHPALAEAYKKIYGWTSDEGGIRHALSDKGDVEITLADARYMLVSCSAFVNYLISNAENT